jgi:hypothetical protein
MGAHEWCFYGWREGAAHQFYGPANATDLWSIISTGTNARVRAENPDKLQTNPAISFGTREV